MCAVAERPELPDDVVRAIWQTVWLAKRQHAATLIQRAWRAYDAMPELIDRSPGVMSTHALHYLHRYVTKPCGAGWMMEEVD